MFFTYFLDFSTNFLKFSENILTIFQKKVFHFQITLSDSGFSKVDIPGLIYVITYKIYSV